MNIVYIYNEIVTFGGIQRVMCDKMNALVENNHEVTFITFEHSQEQADNVIYKLNAKIKRIKLYFPFYVRFQYDLLRRTYFLSQMRMAFTAELYAVLSEIDPDIVCVANDVCTLEPVLDASPNAIHILESHNYRLAETLGKSWLERKLKLLEIKYYDRYVRKYDCVVALTHQDAEEWKGAKRVEVIPNVVPLVKRENVAKRPKHVISVGRLSYQKGYELLIEAWKEVYKKHPDWHLDIYGDGDLRPKLQHMIDESMLSEAITINPASSDIHSIYGQYQFYIMSSRHEGFGLTLIEAMQHGLPCVSFSCPCGPADLIDDGYNGLLVTNGDTSSLAIAICRMIEKEDLEAMSSAAINTAQKYTPEAIMPQWEHLFESLQNNRNAL